MQAISLNGGLRVSVDISMILPLLCFYFFLTPKHFCLAKSQESPMHSLTCFHNESRNDADKQFAFPTDSFLAF